MNRSQSEQTKSSTCMHLTTWSSSLHFMKNYYSQLKDPICRYPITLYTNKKQCPTCSCHDRKLDPLPSTPSYSIRSTHSRQPHSVRGHHSLYKDKHHACIMLCYPKLPEIDLQYKKKILCTTTKCLQSVYEYFLKASFQTAVMLSYTFVCICIKVWVNLKPFLKSYCMLLDLLWTLHWSKLFQIK